jgi:hypothetical protein
LGDGRVSPRTVKDNVSGDAAGEGTLGIEVSNASQVAFALFTHISQEKQRRGKLHFGLDQSVGDGQHSDQSGAVVAGPRGFKTVAVNHRIQRRFQGKNRIEMC